MELKRFLHDECFQNSVIARIFKDLNFMKLYILNNQELFKKQLRCISPTAARCREVRLRSDDGRAQLVRSVSHKTFPSGSIF